MMGMLDDLIVYLDAAGIGLTDGTNLFGSRMLDAPDAQVVLYEAPGLPNEETFGLEQAAVWNHGLQVQVRGAAWDYPGANSVAVAVLKELQKIVNETVNGNRYFHVSHNNGPSLLEYDRDERPVLVLNFDVKREPA